MPERVGELEHGENPLLVLFFTLLGGESHEQAQVVLLHFDLFASCLELTLGAMFVQSERRLSSGDFLIVDGLEDALDFPTCADSGTFAAA